MATLLRFGGSEGVSDRWRWLAVAPLAGGVLWLSNRTLVPLLIDPFYSIDGSGVRVLQLLHLVVSPLLLVGVVAFYEQYASAYSRWGRGGAWALALGFVVIWLVELLRVALGGFGFSYVGIGAAVARHVGTLLVGLGAIGVGLDCWRTGTPSRWMAVWFALGVVVSLVGGGDGSGLYPILPYPLESIVVVARETYYDQLFGLVWTDTVVGEPDLYGELFGVVWIGFGYRLWRPARTGG